MQTVQRILYMALDESQGRSPTGNIQEAVVVAGFSESPVDAVITIRNHEPRAVTPRTEFADTRGRSYLTTVVPSLGNIEELYQLAPAFLIDHLARTSFGSFPYSAVQVYIDGFSEWGRDLNIWLSDEIKRNTKFSEASVSFFPKVSREEAYNGGFNPALIGANRKFTKCPLLLNWVDSAAHTLASDYFPERGGRGRTGLAAIARERLVEIERWKIAQLPKLPRLRPLVI